MKRPLTLLLLLTTVWVLGARYNRDVTVRIKIKELLEPATRIGALRAYRAAVELPSVWKTEAAFVKAHAGLQVRTFQPKGRTPEYIVTWRGSSAVGARDFEPWPAEPPRPGITDLQETFSAYRFAADGSQLPVPGDPAWELAYLDAVDVAAIEDLNGDGVPEYIRAKRNDAGDATDGKQVFTEALEISSVSGNCLIIYNSHPVRWAQENTWGCELRQVAGVPGWEIALGPVAGLREIRPAAAVRWDSGSRKWKAFPREDAHLRVENFAPGAASSDHLLQTERVLDYPRQGAPSGLAQALDLDSLSPRGLRLNKPWRHASLSGKSDEELAAWFLTDKDVSTRWAEERQQWFTVPALWEMPVREAAREYVRAHCSPLTRATTIFDFAAGSEQPPTEGEVEMRSVRGGCFGSTTRQTLIRCAEGRSFLLVYESVFNRVAFAPWLPSPEPGEVHRIALSDAEARRILQFVWHMTRVRGRALARLKPNGFHGSTAWDQNSLQLRVGGETLELENAGGHYLNYPGELYLGAPSAPAICASITDWFLRTDLPASLGQRWSEASSRQDKGPDAGEPQVPTPRDLARWKEANRQILQQYLQGDVGSSFAREAIAAAGYGLWEDFHPLLAQISAVLARDTAPAVKELLALDEAIGGWVKKLGSDAGESGWYAREEARSRRQKPAPEPATPDPLPDLGINMATPAPISAAGLKRYQEVDKLHARRLELQASLKAPERETYPTLKAVQQAQQQLRVCHDVEALRSLARDDEQARLFAFRCLARISPDEALTALRSSGATDDYFYREFAARLEIGEWQKDWQTVPESRAALLQALSGPAAGTAMDVILPSGEERKVPGDDIDAALERALTAPSSQANLDRPWQRLAMALASRQGAAAWDTLFSVLKRSPAQTLFPALCRLAPAVSEERKDALEQQVTEALRPPCSAWVVNDFLWAAWLLDGEELKSEVERQAVRSPQDYEGPAGVHGAFNRTHMGRRLAAVWNEEDALTRAKLLALLTVKERKRFESAKEGTITIVAGRFRAAAGGLSEAQRESLRAFGAGLEKEHPQAQEEVATVCAAVR